MIEVLGIIVGIIGIISSVYFYWKGGKNIEVLDSLMNVNYRLYEDLDRAGFRRGRIKKNPDGTYSIDWEIKLTAEIQSSHQLSTEVKTNDEQERDSEEE